MIAAVLGCGRLGTSLARALAAGGHDVVAWSRSKKTAARARSLGVNCAAGPLPARLSGASLVFVTVSDPAIAALALEARPRAAKGALLVHCSARLDLTNVDGSLHPLRALADGSVDLAGAACAVDARTPRGLKALTSLARALGMMPVRVNASRRARYHAGAVLASGSLVALLHAAAGELAACGFKTRKAALDALLPLAKGTLETLSGARWPLTGPVARGDVDAVRAHLAALSPSARAIYASIASEQLSIASSQRMATKAALGAVARALLQPPTGKRRR